MQSILSNRSRNTQKGSRREAVLYLSVKDVLPPKFTNIVRTALTGFFNPTSGGFQQHSYMTLFANSVFEPFNTSSSSLSGQPFNAAPATSGFAGTTTSNSSNTTNPAGYTQMTRVYNSYRVNKFSLKWTMAPANSADNIRGTISANPQPGIYTTPFVLSLTEVQGASGIVQRDFVYGQMCYLVKAGTSWEALGLSQAQWLDLPVTDVTSEPTAEASVVYQLNAFVLSAGVGTSVSFLLELEQEVEWSNPNPTNLES